MSPLFLNGMDHRCEIQSSTIFITYKFPDCDIAASMPSMPYASKDIHVFLENKQSLLESDKGNNDPSSLALAMTSKLSKSFSTIVCSNCKHMRYTTEYCISKGGGIVGKTTEELKMVWKKSSSKAPKPTSKVPVTMKNSNGQAFTVMIDSSTLNNAEATKGEFSSLASDPLLHASIERVKYWVFNHEGGTS